MTILDEHVETAGYLREQIKITSINIESQFNNIDLPINDNFWNEDYRFDYLFVDKTPSNHICACITMVNIDLAGPHNEGVFDGQKLEYTGEGLFKQDDSDMFLLESSFDATHKISYHIEANVVSTIPVPTAFYFFSSGIFGLMFNRIRKA